MESENKTALR